MTQTVSLNIKGLVTNVNQLAAVDGALLVADNVVINKDSVAEMCRGFETIERLQADCKKLIFYQGKLLNNETLKDHSGSLRAVSSHSNLYLVTDSGVIKLDSATATPIPAGLPKALDLTGEVTEVGGFLPSGQQVAYRVVWGYEDVNKNLILGTPSQRLIVINEERDQNSRKVKLEFPVPPGISERHFYQIYRSEASTDASDELALVIQQNPTVDQIRLNRISVTDAIPRTLSGAALYTNATQEGILQSNDQPPISGDIAVFRDCMFYGNTRSQYELFLTLNQVGGTHGLAVGDRIKIGNTNFTASQNERFESKEFAVSQDGSSLAISKTIASLVRVINQSQSEVYAYSFETSEDPDDIGKILLESRFHFSVETAGNPSSFSPTLPQSATCEINKNVVYFSKFQQMEAVPILNSMKIGPSDQAVIRMIPLRDGLFVFSESGVYRINGWTPETFNLEHFDSSLKLVAPETPAVLNNHIFCLTTQGVIAINDVGSTLVSQAIQDIILFLLSPSMIETTRKFAFGIAYESESKYILFVPSHPKDLACTRALVYHSLTKTWTRWIRTATCGLVHPLEDRLYLGLNKEILVERKGTENDYLDEAGHPIESRIEWHPQHAGAPFALKQWAEAELTFRKRGKFELSFKSDLSPHEEAIQVPNGGRFFRTYIPAQKQICSTLTVGLTCKEPFELEGICLTTTATLSERISR